METTNCTITITAIESTEKKIVLKDGNLKYYFWKHKQDGNETKAFQQFQKFHFSTGDLVDAAVKEQERTFTNEKGKEITYMDRNIAFFLVQDNTPVATQTQNLPPRSPESPKNEKQAGSEHSAALKAYLQQLETRIRVIEDWKDKQPTWTQVSEGDEILKWQMVPPCFD